MYKTALLLSTLLLNTATHAAILIESVNDDGKTGRVLIDEGRARIDAGTLGGYMLINLDTGSAYAINHAERAILDLRSPILSTNPHSSAMTQKPPAITFKKMGKGPVVAGYETTRYRVSIDGMHCFDELLSEQLLNYPHVKRFAEVIGEASGADSITGMGVPFDPEAPCESADELADDYYHKLGIPMRTIGSNGLVTHEIKRIDTNMEPPAGTFASPPGYNTVTREELLERAASKIPAHANSSTLSTQEVEKMQEQIKKQLEAMKKRRQGTATPEDLNGIDIAPVNH
jgi:hypothetical protein